LKFLKKILDNPEHAARNIIFSLMLVISAFCFTESFMHTMELKQTEEAFEKIIYHSDNFILNGIVLISVLVILSILIKKIEKIPLKIMTVIMSAIVIISGILWVYSSRLHPVEDSFMVTDAAKRAAVNDYGFVKENYYNTYPFQLGYVFFCEILIRIFGTDRPDLLYMQVLNVLMLAASYCALVFIIRKVTGSKKSAVLAVLAFTLCPAPVIYTSFLYGVIPGFTFSVYALLFEILFFKTEKKIRFLYLALSAVCIGTAVMIKMNNYIFLVAIIITAAVLTVKKFRISSLLFIAAVFAVSMTINPLVKSRYEKLADTRLDPGIPIISYISMGLHYPENVAGCTAAGWYNGYYTVVVYDQYEHDLEKVKKESLSQVKERLGFFINNFTECDDFFYEKNMSQWNEPTYSCIWLNQNRPRYDGKCGKIAEYICGDGTANVSSIMNLLQMFTYLGVLAGIYYGLKYKKDIFYCTIPLIVLGGFMYHMFAEGKSQYILPYYILLCGFSACGTEILCEKTSVLLNGISSLFSFKTIESDNAPKTDTTDKPNRNSKKGSQVSSKNRSKRKQK